MCVCRPRRLVLQIYLPSYIYKKPLKLACKIYIYAVVICIYIAKKIKHETSSISWHIYKGVNQLFLQACQNFEEILELQIFSHETLKNYIERQIKFCIGHGVNRIFLHVKNFGALLNPLCCYI